MRFCKRCFRKNWLFSCKKKFPRNPLFSRHLPRDVSPLGNCQKCASLAAAAAVVCPLGRFDSHQSGHTHTSQSKMHAQVVTHPGRKNNTPHNGGTWSEFGNDNNNAERDRPENCRPVGQTLAPFKFLLTCVFRRVCLCCEIHLWWGSTMCRNSWKDFPFIGTNPYQSSWFVFSFFPVVCFSTTTYDMISSSLE